MGYFTLPASIGHHGKEEGDLYLHSRTVARLLEEFTRKEHLLWQRPESPKIIGLLHDLCKTEEYEKKNFMGSYYYGRNEGAVLQGHGEISVMIAQNIGVDSGGNAVHPLPYGGLRRAPRMGLPAEGSRTE